MTQNQINYANYLEMRKHNELTRNEIARHNLANEKYNIDALAEQSRHNQVTEGESNRHNLASEAQASGVLRENIRHNYSTENINASYNTMSLSETQRHNVETETLNRRAQSIQEYANVSGRISALTNVKNAFTNVSKQHEEVRHNMATERITSDKLDEEVRHNKQAETTQQSSVWWNHVDASTRNSETERHNIASENIDKSRISESARHNYATEGETARHNYNSEIISAFGTFMNALGTFGRQVITRGAR